jgi:hypothetical protein
MFQQMSLILLYALFSITDVKNSYSRTCTSSYHFTCGGISEVFNAAKIQVEVFWVMTLCSVVVGYRRFGGPCLLPPVSIEDTKLGFLTRF